MLFSAICRAFLDTHIGRDYENSFQKFYDMMKQNKVFTDMEQKDLDLDFMDFDLSKCDEKRVRSSMAFIWISNCNLFNHYVQFIEKLTASSISAQDILDKYNNKSLIKIVNAAPICGFRGFKDGTYVNGKIHTAYKQAVLADDVETINKALVKIKNDKPEEVKIDKTPESPQDIKKELEAVKIIETMRQEIVDLRAQVVAANQKRSQETGDHFSKLDKIVESVVAENEALKTKLKEAEDKLVQETAKIETFKTQFAPLLQSIETSK